jgi:hypothetical protein
MNYSLPKVHRIFHEQFNCKPPLDGLLMMVFKRPVIDIAKFDVILHERHGEYEEKQMSMQDILEKEYPAGIAGFIHWLIGAE